MPTAQHERVPVPVRDGDAARAPLARPHAAARRPARRRARAATSVLFVCLPYFLISLS